jgi:hypothetical protein
VSDDGFPSGPWVGFYNYWPGDGHRMDLHLDFSNGCMGGDGNDDLGRFLIRGKYDSTNRECSWTKTYPGSHDVYYRGFREGKGIWGTWEIGILAHGGFHIWPKGEHEGEVATAAAEAAGTVDAVGKDQDAGVSEIPAATALASAQRIRRASQCSGKLGRLWHRGTVDRLLMVRRLRASWHKSPSFR